MNLIKSTVMTIPALIVVAAFLSFLRMVWDFQVHFLEAVAAPWFYSAGAVLHIGGWGLLGLSVAASANQGGPTMTSVTTVRSIGVSVPTSGGIPWRM